MNEKALTALFIALLLELKSTIMRRNGCPGRFTKRNELCIYIRMGGPKASFIEYLPTDFLTIPVADSRESRATTVLAYLRLSLQNF
jgi:hypothetical protein